MSCIYDGNQFMQDVIASLAEKIYGKSVSKNDDNYNITKQNLGVIFELYPSIADYINSTNDSIDEIVSQLNTIYKDFEEKNKEVYYDDILTNNQINTKFEPVKNTYDKELQEIKERAIANGTFMKAPNGKPTNLNERQWLQVRTKTFKDWFGDWINDPANASKVVDENGEPLVVYHGSENKFSVFDKNAEQRGSLTNILKKGFYFSNREIAGQYVSSKEIEDYHKLEELQEGGYRYEEILEAFGADINDEESMNKVSAYLQYLENYDFDSGNLYAVFLNIKSPVEVDLKGEIISSLTKEQKAAINNSEGAVLKNVDETTSLYRGDWKPQKLYVGTDYIVFNPNQIKSATDNVGSFSRENDDIYNENLYESSLDSIDKELKQLSNNKSKTVLGIRDILEYLSKNEKYKTIIQALSSENSNRSKKLLGEIVNGYNINIVLENPDYTFGDFAININNRYKTKRAYYDAKTNTIYINTSKSYDNGDASDVVFHELMHAITVHRIKNNDKFIKKFEDIINDFQNSNYDPRYDETNEHRIEEFVANVWTDKYTIETLKSTKSSRNNKLSIWERVKKFFKELFKDCIEHSLFEEVTNELFALLEEPVTYFSNEQFNEDSRQLSFNFDERSIPEYTIEYTPKGKQRQNYTIRGSHIYNKNGKEVFTTDSVDRNKIFANLAVRQGRAVIVDYTKNNKTEQFVVNNKDSIVSIATGKIMNWPENDGKRKSIIELAHQKFEEKQNASTVENQDKNENKSKQLTLADFDVELANGSKDLLAKWRGWIKSNPYGIVAYRTDRNKFSDPEYALETRSMGNPFFGWLKDGDKTRDTKLFNRWLRYGETAKNPIATEELRQAYISLIKEAAENNAKVLYYTNIPPSESHAAIIGYYIQHPEELNQTENFEEYKNNIETLSGYFEGGGTTLSDMISIPEELAGKLSDYFIGNVPLDIEDYRNLWEYVQFGKNENGETILITKEIRDAEQNQNKQQEQPQQQESAVDKEFNSSMVLSRDPATFSINEDIYALFMRNTTNEDRRDIPKLILSRLKAHLYERGYYNVDASQIDKNDFESAFKDLMYEIQVHTDENAESLIQQVINEIKAEYGISDEEYNDENDDYYRWLAETRIKNRARAYNLFLDKNNFPLFMMIISKNFQFLYGSSLIEMNNENKEADEEVDENNEESEVDERPYGLSSMNVSSFNKMSKRLKRLLSTVLKLDSEGNNIINSLGEFETYEASELFPQLAQKLSKAKNEVDFFVIFDKLCKYNPSLNIVKNEIEKDNILKAQFYRVFNKQNNEYDYISEGSILSSNRKDCFTIVFNEWKSNLFTDLSDKENAYNKDGYNKAVELYNNLVKNTNEGLDKANNSQEYIDSCTKLFDMLGININANKLFYFATEMSENIDNKYDNIKQLNAALYSTISYISKALQSLDSKKLAHKSSLVYESKVGNDSFKRAMAKVCEIVGMAAEPETEHSVHNLGKMYYAFSNLNQFKFYEKKIHFMNQEEREQWIDNEFLVDPWFKLENADGSSYIANDLIKSIRNQKFANKLLDIKTILNIEGKDYTRLDQCELLRTQLKYFYKSVLNDNNYAYFQVPICSDSEGYYFYSNKVYGTETLLGLDDVNKRERWLVNVVMQEYNRIQRVKKRNLKEGDQGYIPYYDGARGRKFLFVPELNTYEETMPDGSVKSFIDIIDEMKTANNGNIGNYINYVIGKIEREKYFRNVHSMMHNKDFWDPNNEQAGFFPKNSESHKKDSAIFNPSILNDIDSYFDGKYRNNPQYDEALGKTISDLEKLLIKARDMINVNSFDMSENHITELLKTLYSIGQYYEIFKKDEIKNKDGGTIMLSMLTNHFQSHIKVGTYKYSLQDVEQEYEYYYCNDHLFKFSVNNTKSTIDIYQLMTTDIAYYRDMIEVQKRWKQFHSPMERPYINSKYGRKTERSIYLQDEEVKSELYGVSLHVVDLFVKNKKISKAVGESVKNAMKKAYSEINVTDAQGFRTVKSTRCVMDMLGQFTEKMESAFDKLINKNDPSEMLGLMIPETKPFMQATVPQKSVYMKDDNVVTETLRMPTQHKYAESMMIYNYAKLLDPSMADKFPRLAALADVMEEGYDTNNGGIDIAIFNSGVKEGCVNTIDLSEKRIKQYIEENDVKGKDEYEKIYNATKEILNSTIKDSDGKYNSFTHEHPYENYGAQTPMPEHLYEAKSGVGTQFRKLRFANFEYEDQDGNPYFIHVGEQKITVKKAIDLYNGCNVARLLKQYKMLTKQNSTADEATRKIISDVVGDQIDIDSASLLQNAKDNGVFIDPALREKIEKATVTQIRKSLQKQSVTGGACVQCSCFGTDSLNIVYGTRLNDGSVIEFRSSDWLKKNKGKTLDDFVDYVKQNMNGNSLFIVAYECYMPAWSENIVKYCGYKDSNGEFHLDPSKMPKDLMEFVGYRIPTETGYSTAPLRVKGFISSAIGSAIILPKEITAITGSDFDGDKFYVLLHNSRIRIDIRKAKDATSKHIVRKYADTKTKEEIQEIYADIVEGEDAVKKIIDYINSSEDKSLWKDSVRIEKIPYGDITKDDFNIMSLPLNAIDNLFVDLSRASMTDEQSALNMIQPGNFDELKRLSRYYSLMNNTTLDDVLDAIENLDTDSKSIPESLKAAKTEIDAIKKSVITRNENIQKQNREQGTDEAYEKVSLKDIYKIIEGLDLKAMDKLHSIAKKEFNPTSFATFMDLHKQNMTGKLLIGIYALNSVHHSIMQRAGIKLSRAGQRLFGLMLNELDPMYAEDGSLISTNIAYFANASVDNAKDPVLTELLQAGVGSNITCTLLRLGFSVKHTMLLLQVLLSNSQMDEVVLKASAINDKKGIRSSAEYKQYMSNDGIDINEAMLFDLKTYALDLGSMTPAYLLALSDKFNRMNDAITDMAEDLTEMVLGSRADTTHGCARTDVALSLLNLFKFNKSIVRSKKKSNHLISKDSLKNSYSLYEYIKSLVKNSASPISLTSDEKLDEIYGMIMKSEIPISDGFAAVGLILGLNIFSNISPFLRPENIDKIETVYKQFSKFKSNDNDFMYDVLNDLFAQWITFGMSDEDNGVDIFKQSMMPRTSTADMAEMIARQHSILKDKFKDNTLLDAIEFSENGVFVHTERYDINDLKSDLNQMLMSVQDDSVDKNTKTEIRDFFINMLQYEYKRSNFGKQFGSFKNVMTTQLKQYFGIDKFISNKFSEQMSDDFIASFLYKNHLGDIAVTIKDVDDLKRIYWVNSDVMVFRSEDVKLNEYFDNPVMFIKIPNEEKNVDIFKLVETDSAGNAKYTKCDMSNFTSVDDTARSLEKYERNNGNTNHINDDDFNQNGFKNNPDNGKMHQLLIADPGDGIMTDEMNDSINDLIC